MIRNAITFSLPHGWPFDPSSMSELLKRRQFLPCGDADSDSSGFVPPVDGGPLCREIGGRLVVAFQTEEKLLPTSVVAEHAEIRAEELERQQGFRLGRRQMREIKENVIAELLPQAFTRKRRTLAWVSRQHDMFVIDAASENRAEDVLSAMRDALHEIPAARMDTETSPTKVMSEWLSEGETGGSFEIGRDCQLVSPDEERASLRYTRHDLSGEDVAAHLAAGKRPILLGLTFDERVKFVLDSRLYLKRITLLDIVMEGAEPTGDDELQFDADFTLAAAEIERVIADLIGECGGLAEREEGDLIDNGAAYDPLYEQAKQVVIDSGRPAISLVQRHLRIGYNRAARLIEQMERDKLVSRPDENGAREVIEA